MTTTEGTQNLNNLKILWHSNSPLVATGYGNQTRLFTPRLKALGHEIEISAFYGYEPYMAPSQWNGINITGRGFHPYGIDVLPAKAKTFNADIVLTLLDAWIFDLQTVNMINWCVPAGTLVTMSNGEKKPIEDIREGDRVMSCHVNKSVFGSSEVKRTWKIPSEDSGEIIEIVTNNGNRLEVTADNQIAVMNNEGDLEWIGASLLTSGDMVYCNSSIPLHRRSNYDASQTEIQQHSNSPHSGMEYNPNANRSSLRSRNNRRGGNSFNTPSLEEGQEKTSLHTNPESLCVEHESRIIGVASRQDRHESELQNKTGQEVQERTRTRVDASSEWLSVLQPFESCSAVSDSEERQSGVSDAVYRDARKEHQEQSTLLQRRTRGMVEGSGVEPQKISSVRRKGKPYRFVYDLTTEDGNFFAGDILIHNCPWFPVDSDPIPPDVLEKVRYAFERIVYSKFAEKQLQDFDVPCYYVPHGVDTKVFAPVSATARADARKMVFNFPADAFIVGMVAANKGYPSRKAFEQNIAAFKKLSDKHSDAILFLQTWTGAGGPAGRDCVDLEAYCRTIGLQLGKNVFYCDQFMNATTGFPDPYMVALYNSMDVLLSVSRGEGFGIPIVEAQACGTPVITGDWTSMSELTFSGWKVHKDEAVLDPTWQKTNWYLPLVDPIADRLEMAYQMRGNQDYRDRARKGALAYDVDTVTQKYWKPTLETIAQRIQTVKKIRERVQAKPTGKVEVKEVTA